MKVFVAVDDNYGMLFNKRRQSQDKVLRAYILSIVNQKTLYMNEYTYKQFTVEEGNLIVSNEYLDQIEKDEFCFIETESLKSIEHQISELYLCKWNRRYPADMYLDIKMDNTWEVVSTTDIVGSSHEKITIEKWTNKEYKFS